VPLERRDDVSALRAGEVSREAGSRDATARDQPRALPRGAGPARAVPGGGRRLSPRRQAQSTGSECGRGRAQPRRLATPLDVGLADAPDLRSGRPALSALVPADAPHRHHRGPRRHAADPRPCRAPGHAGRPAAVLPDRGRRRATRTPGRHRLRGAVAPGSRGRPPCSCPVLTWRTLASCVGVPIWPARRSLAGSAPN